MSSMAVSVSPDVEPVKQPRVWLLMGHRIGDNSQVQALGEALGWPYEIKRFVYRPYELATNLLLGPTLAGMVPEKSSKLEPPWPDLIISAGRRNEPICRWIQKQAGGRDRVKLVHLGRPWAWIKRFDLVITTPQYRLPRLPNVLHNDTTIHRVTRERLSRAAAELAPRVAHLPRPYITVLVGGNSGPYSFTVESARRLARQAGDLARAQGGSLLITTSARTPAEAADALEAAIDVPAFVYRWRGRSDDNPYYGLLGQANSIVVTADSVSMVTEACASGRPVYLFDLGEGWNSMRAPIGVPGEQPAPMPSFSELRRDFDLRAFVYRMSMRFGPKRMTRDIRIIHRNLVSAGRAVWLDEGQPAAAPPPLQDLDRAVTRVRGLFEATASRPALVAVEPAKGLGGPAKQVG